MDASATARPKPATGTWRADLGYRLQQRYWRRGYASEGARELVRHGFEDLGLTRIFAQTMAVNQASRATMASVGLKLVRTFAEEYDVPIPGHEQGEVEYDITQERWLTEFGGRHVHDPDPQSTND
jgi:RimJ/RimL family protein N-acetyltransferase